MGYHFTLNKLRVATVTLERALTKLRQLYEQGATVKRLAQYWKRFLQWVNGGVKNLLDDGHEAIEQRSMGGYLSYWGHAGGPRDTGRAERGLEVYSGGTRLVGVPWARHVASVRLLIGDRVLQPGDTRPTTSTPLLLPSRRSTHTPTPLTDDLSGAVHVGTSSSHPPLRLRYLRWS